MNLLIIGGCLYVLLILVLWFGVWFICLLGALVCVVVSVAFDWLGC